MAGMTYEEVIEFAKKHYAEGGDGTYECLDKKTYDYCVAEFGPYTKEKLLDEFARYKSHCDEMMSLAW